MMMIQLPPLRVLMMNLNLLIWHIRMMNYQMEKLFERHYSKRVIYCYDRLIRPYLVVFHIILQ